MVIISVYTLLAWQAWHLATSIFTLRGRRGTYGTGLALVAPLVLRWRWVLRLFWRGRRGTWRYLSSLCVAGVALMALGWLWWRAWFSDDAGRCGFWRGRRGTWRFLSSLCVAGVARMALGWLRWRAWAGVAAVAAAAVGVAGVALGDIHPSFHVAGVLLGDNDFHFVWQAWYLVTSHQIVTHHLSHTTLSHTPHLLPHHLSHTTLSHTIFYTQLCHTLSFTPNFHTHYLSHTTLSHTIFDTPLCHTPSFTHHLSHTIFVTPLCHTPFFAHHLSHHFVTRHLSHTTLSHTIFDTPLCHTPSFTHHTVTHTIFHTTLSHHLSHTQICHTFCCDTTLSHTVFYTPLCHTPSLSHTIFHTQLCHTPSLSHTIFHTQLCHTPSLTTPSFTRNFVTHHLLHTTLSHTIFHHTIFHTHNFVTHHLSSTSSFVSPSFPVPATTLVAHYWKKLTCGVIRSFNFRPPDVAGGFNPRQYWRVGIVNSNVLEDGAGFRSREQRGGQVWSKPSSRWSSMDTRTVSATHPFFDTKSGTSFIALPWQELLRTKSAPELGRYLA